MHDPAPSPRPGPARYANVDRLRLLAILTIIQYHCPGSEARPIFLRFGIATFLLITCTFRSQRPFDFRTRSGMGRRARRLLAPWLFWSAVFGAQSLRWVLMGVPAREVFETSMVLYGTRVHLWFLPFLFFMEILVSVARRITRPLPGRFRLPLVLTAGAATLASVSSIETGYWLFDAWIFGLASVPLGLLFSEVLDAQPGPRRSALLASASLSLLTLGILGGNAGWDEPLVRYAVAAGLLAGALAERGRSDAVSRLLAASVLGVYLVHPLVLRQLRQRTGIFDWPLPIVVIIIAAISLGLVLLLKRTPLRRFV